MHFVSGELFTKIIIKKINSIPKEEVLFPGYIFIKTNVENYSAVKFTKGIKNLIQFGNNISCMYEDEIQSIKIIEKESQTNPISSNICVGQEAYIKDGSLKGSIVKICSLPAKKRLDVLIYMLGSERRINVPLDTLSF